MKFMSFGLRYAKAVPLLILLGAVLISCSLTVVQPTDTTPPTITAVTTDPSPVYNNHPFTLIVKAEDPESAVTISLDMNADGVFGDSKVCTYTTAGTRTIAVKASSAGGTVVKYYSITVTQVVLSLSLTYTASSNSATGNFITDYTITNNSNVPITITSSSSLFYEGLTGPALTDISISRDTLVNGTSIDPGGAVAEQRDGNSTLGTPHYFDYSFTYDDGYGNGKTSVFANGAFVVY